MPPEPHDNAPGFARASAINSCTVLALTPGCIASMVAALATGTMAVKSRGV